MTRGAVLDGLASELERSAMERREVASRHNTDIEL